MDTSWWPDELAHAGPEHLDPGYVAGYDRKQGWPPVDEDVALVRAHGARTVVDLGAGTGRFAAAAAPHCDRVVAVDVSPAMLDHARRAAGIAGTTVEFVRAGFLSYEHTGPPADFVHTRNALENAATDPAAGYTAEDYATHLRTEFSTYRWLLEPLLAATGFDILDVAADEIFATYTCRLRP